MDGRRRAVSGQRGTEPGVQVDSSVVPPLTCGRAFMIQIQSAGTPGAPKPPPPPAPVKTSAKPPPPPATDPRYGTCKEAKAHGYGPYVKGVDPEYYWYRDADSDGIVCE